MSWGQVTLTESGESLLAKMLNGSKLTFTRVALGDTTIAEELLPKQTDVSSPISAPALIAGKEDVESGNGAAIIIQIRNDGVSETTRMRQIGLFAKSEHDDSDVLFGILQDDIGEEIPANADFPQFEISLAVAIAVSRTNNIEVVVSPLVYAKQKDLEALKKSCEESFEELTQAGEDGISAHNTDENAHAGRFAAATHTHTKSEITDFPESLPANGGNADTVGNQSISTSNEVGLRKISAGTEDLTAGTSELETGTIYLVYE